MFPNLSTAAARRLRGNGPFHLPPPAAPLGSSVTLTVEDCPQQPEAVITDTRRPNLTWRVALRQVSAGTWTTTIQLPGTPTILTYEFRFADADTPPLREQRQIEGRNQPIYGEWEARPFKIAVYDADRQPADWTKGMVIYQIFPDRFADGDPTTNRANSGVYGHAPLFKAWGDLPEQPPLGRDFFGGDLRGIIDKLPYLHDLGVETIYLTPIFHAATNHRYEAIDYFKIDPMLGTEADLTELLDKAHARGMKIVLDGVFNHCSADSAYFQNARSSKESPYYRWFTFTNHPDGHQGWWGYGFMPEFVECPEVEAFFNGPDGVAAYWLHKGIDGWRLDVAFDNTLEFWQHFRTRVDAVKPGAYTVSELWIDSTHYFLGDTFNATMNYRFTWLARGFLAYGRLTPTEVDDRVQTFLRDTPPPAVLSQMNPLDSHDTDRILTACGGHGQRAKAVVAFQLAFPGAPMLYYGGETGLEGTAAEDGRRCMPWDALDSDLIGWFKAALAARRDLLPLRLGTYRTVVIDDARGVYAFARAYHQQTVYCAFNRADAPAAVTIPDVRGTWRDALNGGETIQAAGELSFTLPPYGAAWWAGV
ncbi:MAG: glycoside hydrolase family 13 protein [bacterium]|nr:glycoside hydrolase family 13 protein [bacterium]